MKQNPACGIESTMFSKSIWVPCFKKTDGFKSFNLKESASLKDISQKEVKKNSMNKEIEYLEQNIAIEMKGDSEYMNGLKVLPNENDVVIKDSFMISIINMDILSETFIPTVFTTVIYKDSFMMPYGI